MLSMAEVLLTIKFFVTLPQKNVQTGKQLPETVNWDKQ